MAKRLFTLAAAAVLLSLGTTGLAYDFWGITLATANYMGAQQLTFSNVAASGAQYEVGGYKYTKVDSSWLGPFAAASPGAAYDVHRKCDAEGIFFRPQGDNAEFVIIAGTAQGGFTAPEVGYGTRKFGPGDLKIDVGGSTYGIGLRLDGLPWAVENTSNPNFQIYKATGGIDSIHARDAGTLDRVELNPRWDHTDHYDLPAGGDAGFAFYVKNSGSSAGTASALFGDTGVLLGGAHVYAYTVDVPFATIGIGSGNYDFTMSWRPDCGNDLISKRCTVSRPNPEIPEPASIVLALLGGLPAVGLRRLRRR